MKFTTSHSLVPRPREKGGLVSTVCTCAAPQVFLGNLDTTAILVRMCYCRCCKAESSEVYACSDGFLLDSCLESDR